MFGISPSYFLTVAKYVLDSVKRRVLRKFLPSGNVDILTFRRDLTLTSILEIFDPRVFHD